MCWQFIFFILKKKLVFFFFLNLKIIKNLVGFFEENIFIYFQIFENFARFSCEDLGKFSRNLSFFFIFLIFFNLKILNLKFVENLIVFSLKKNLVVFYESFDILAKIQNLCKHVGNSWNDLVVCFGKWMKTLLGFCESYKNLVIVLKTLWNIICLRDVYKSRRIFLDF